MTMLFIVCIVQFPSLQAICATSMQLSDSNIMLYELYGLYKVGPVNVARLS